MTSNPNFLPLKVPHVCQQVFHYVYEFLTDFIWFIHKSSFINFAFGLNLPVLFSYTM